MIKENYILKNLPQLTKQISSADINNLIEDRYVEIVPQWMPLQVEWMNSLYRTFLDPEKFMIVMHLIAKTFKFYAENFVKLDYENYFNQERIEIKVINVAEISKALNIPKETTRRKINELEELGSIKRANKKIIIDRKTWPNIKPQDTIIRVSRFLSILSKSLHEEKKISQKINSKEIVNTVEKYFSYVWMLYYDMQIPMLLSFKKRFGDLESFHIWGICVVNQIFHSLKNENSHMSREHYLEKYLFKNENILGVNAMSISDISGIPRATVIRKLDKLIKLSYLKVDSKKHYLLTGIHAKELKEIQKVNMQNLSKFAARIYNLTIQAK
jgi:DNA-binding Lrp family transcriptional regulator|tara:strand:- start:516 stop:1499 length:984 start_codon:yes stop_codon:yes gene_type:complete